MPKRVFIIHGWGGHTEEGIFPWLKSELQEKGFSVFVPSMPNPLKPEIAAWVGFLAEQVGTPYEDTYFFGHSIGAQTILRYLMLLPEGSKIGGAVFLAGWTHLTDAAYETEEDREIAKPWLEAPLDWDRIKSHANKFTGIFSDNDDVVPIAETKTFADNLAAKIIIEESRGHFSGSDGIKELPSALQALLEMAE